MIRSVQTLVPICFSANFLISFTALGALYLNPMPCNLLCMLIVYSRVTTWSLKALDQMGLHDSLRILNFAAKLLQIPIKVEKKYLHGKERS